MLNRVKNQRGQAAIEMALSLPFLVTLIFYTFNAFQSIHTSHIAQKYAAMNLYQRLENRSDFAIDAVAGGGQGQVYPRSFMAVEYRDPQTQGRPQRRILLGPANIQLFNRVGICREPSCN